MDIYNTVFYFSVHESIDGFVFATELDPNYTSYGSFYLFSLPDTIFCKAIRREEDTLAANPLQSLLLEFKLVDNLYYFNSEHEIMLEIKKDREFYTYVGGSAGLVGKSPICMLEDVFPEESYEKCGLLLIGHGDLM